MEVKSIIFISLFLFGLVSSACTSAYGQCGGVNFKGETCCVGGYYCKVLNQWYSQCVPGANQNTSAAIKTTTKKVTTVKPVQTTQKPAQPAQPTQQPATPGKGPGKIFFAGDSTGDGTMGNGGKTVGWGKYLGDYVTCPVSNQAKAGRSSRTFWREGRWTTLINGVGKGDYVFIQFGHNDGGGANDAKERGCVAGTGNETQTVTLKNGQKEVVHTFPWYIRQMVKQVIAKNAHPILLTQTPRNQFTNGKIGNSGRFADYMKMVAKEFGIPCIDHYNYIARQYESLGQNNVKKYFPVDYLHTSPAGADLNAKILVNAFSNCEKINDLVAVLNNKGKNVNLKCAK